MVKYKGKSKMPSASFTTSRSYVRRSRRKLVNRLSHVSLSSSGKLKDFLLTVWTRLRPITIDSLLLCRM